MIRIPDPLTLLASWKGLLVQSVALAACAAAALSWDDDVAHAIALLASSFGLAGLAIPFYCHDRKSHPVFATGRSSRDRASLRTSARKHWSVPPPHLSA